MTTTAIDAISALASAMVEAAVTQLTSTLGPSIEVGDAAVLDTLDAAQVAEGAAAQRHTFDGLEGAIVTMAEQTDDADTNSAVAEALVAGALAAISAIRGEAQLATSDPIEPAVVEAAPTAVVTCELTSIAGSPFKVAWVVEAALGSALQGGAPVAPPAAAPSVAPTLPDLGAIAAATTAAGGPGLDVLADVPMDVTVELGRTTMHVRDLLALGPGSVVELDRLAGAPVDVLVNGTPVATGSVVVVDNELAVRIIDIVDR